MDQELTVKYQNLLSALREMKQVAVAFSGGVDSTFLLNAAAKACPGNVLAVMACHQAVPEREQQAARDFCKQRGIRLHAMTMDVMTVPKFADNPVDRCYHCKGAIFSEIRREAERVFSKDCVLVEGSNRDDLKDYRPGRRAILELGVSSPLLDAGLTKEEIRILSREMELPTWNLPSFACLASRFVYGERITPEKLKRVEMAEEYLRSLGFIQYRVRVHGDLARLEVLPSQMDSLFEKRGPVYEYLKSLGFSHVSMDLGGFVSGSMNTGDLTVR